MSFATRKILQAICIFCIGAATVVTAVGLITLGLNVIPWLLYNKLFVPIFHTQTLSFWQVFGIMWLLSIVGRALTGSRTTTVKVEAKKERW